MAAADSGPRVFLATDQGFSCCDVSAAKVLWSVPSEVPHLPQNNQSGAVLPGLLAWAVYNPGNPGTVSVLDAATGATVWHASSSPLNAGLSLVATTDAFVLTGSTVTGTAAPFSVHAVAQRFAARTGSPGWTAQAPSTLLTSAIVGNTIVLAAGTDVVGIDPASGAQLWDHKQSSQGYMGQKTTTVYVPDRTASTVTCVNVADGSVAWTVHCPQLPWYVAASANYLITVEAAYEETPATLCGYPLSGEDHQLWSIGLSAWPYIGEPECAGDTVLVPSNDSVTAYDGATGASLWTSGKLAASRYSLTVPVVVAGDAMFSSSGTELIGLRVTDGSQALNLDIQATISALVTSA